MGQYEDQDPNLQLLESSVVRNLWSNEKNLTFDQIFDKQKKYLMNFQYVLRTTTTLSFKSMQLSLELIPTANFFKHTFLY